MNWLDELFGWVRVALPIVLGPVLVISGLVSGNWGYAILGAVFCVFGAFILKWVFFGK
jgi:hypothetical protein